MWWLKATVEGDAQQRHGGADDGVEDPKQVGRRVLVDDHVAAYLAPVKAVVPYLDGRHNLEADDVEHVDVERVVAAIDHESLDDALVAVEPLSNVMHHQEADSPREGQGGYRAQFGL